MSAQYTLLLELATDKNTLTQIENSLQNAGVSYGIESQTPLRIRIPSYPVTVALLVTVLEENIALIAGNITLQDGTLFDLNTDGLKAIRQRLISQLKATPTANPSNPSAQGGNGLADILREALRNPEATGKLVKEISSALRGDPSVILEEAKQVSRFTLAIMGLMAVVIAGATFLGYYGKIGGDTVGVVYGTVIGSSFAFLYKYLAAPDESNT